MLPHREIPAQSLQIDLDEQFLEFINKLAQAGRNIAKHNYTYLGNTTCKCIEIQTYKGWVNINFQPGSISKSKKLKISLNRQPPPRQKKYRGNASVKSGDPGTN